jgi:hypothetical protein
MCYSAATAAGPLHDKYVPTFLVCRIFGVEQNEPPPRDPCPSRPSFVVPDSCSEQIDGVEKGRVRAGKRVRDHEVLTPAPPFGASKLRGLSQDCSPSRRAMPPVLTTNSSRK